ncbi:MULTISPECIES: glutathione S-transferase family protein [Methylosinus]|uniref:Glutathione S-transferase family protein n=1 Tax=Methylosinus trichosporium (strain ATCC 35070 / NCIMB 11131 / UNIQEM 75 / OB3b) TaxID=595536 RepID=A0A2D2CUS0_METT3|nr:MULTISPECIES: glutathione S-transferase family protein [Methylosinus]ATQ66571.1 glutathione S-transferase family protein [Methylosinus trichosporium OB3b]OBS54463.1 glutathione S-transferase [Methylosinus sp. 3S-1]
MTSDCKLTFYHSPDTRSTGVFTLLEELGAPYELKALNMKTGEQRESAFLAVNPMGKVPAIVHGDSLVTEQGAIYIYLADLFPAAGLAPAIGDPLRGPYLRWLVFYGSSFEPAVVDRWLQREPARVSTVPYGDFDTMLATLAGQLRKGPYLLGERISAADILWGSALRWTTAFKLVPELPEIMAYVERVTSRPSFPAIAARDAELSALHAAQAQA